MAEKPVDVVKEEVEEYKVETFDNPIAAYSYEEHHARLVDFFYMFGSCNLFPVLRSQLKYFWKGDKARWDGAWTYV